MSDTNQSSIRRLSSRRLVGALAFAFAIICCASVAQAQPTANPHSVAFLPSADQSAIGTDGQPIVTRYDLEFYQVGGTQPFLVLNLGKPAPGTDGYITVDFWSLLSGPPMPGQVLEARVAAVGPAGSGDSTASNQFIFDAVGSPDTTAPFVEITTPTSALTYAATSAALTIGGTASDNVGVTQVSWTNDRGGSGTATGTTAWTASLTLQAGANVISVTSRDAAGNSATVTLTVTYTVPDPMAPSVTITTPTSATTYSTQTTPLAIGGTASDNVGVTQVNWANSRGGGGTATGTTNWTASVALQSGVNVVTVTARDAAGNTATNTLTVTYTPADTTLPTVTITTPTSAATYSTATTPVALGGTASDNVGVTQISWVSDRGGSGTATGTTSWTASVALQSGANVITVTARDAAGNTATRSLTVTYTPPDTTAPTVTITTPTSAATYSTATTPLALGGTASDNVGVTQVSWANSRGGSGTATGTTSWTASVALQSGANVITVTARDAAGNTTTNTLTVTYTPADTTAPAVTITTPTSAATYSAATTPLAIGGTASDNVGVTQITWVNLRGGNGTATGTTAWSASVVLQSGVNVIGVTARDAAGNTSTDTMTVTYGPPPPQHIGVIAGPTDVTSGYSAMFHVAFDSVNQVYLAVWDGGPATGRFLNKQGIPIGDPFNIAVPGEPAAWTNVGFGGPPDKPRFVVTYTIGNGTTNPKMARLVTYRAGAAPDVSAAIKVVDLNGAWSGSEIPRPTWTGQQFILSWSVAATASSTANTAVIGMDVDGNFTTGVQLLGDGLDHEVNATFACGPDTCLATGFAVGLPFGSKGGSWARLFDARTLAPRYSVIYLDDHSGLMENQRAVFDPVTGQFDTVWVRQRAYADFRLVNTDGTKGPLDLTKSIGPVPLGQLATSYNPATRSSLLAFAGSDNDVFGLVLGQSAYPVDLTNVPRLSDGARDRTVIAVPDAAANGSDAQWLVIYSGPNGGRSVVVQGGGIQPPATPAAYTLTARTSGSGTLAVAGTACGTGCAPTFAAGTSVTLAAAPASGYTFTGWTGDNDCADGVVTMDANKTCSATFTPAGGQPPPDGNVPTGPADVTSGYSSMFHVAFDSVNQVYLVVWDGGPPKGRFLNKQGLPIGDPFNIAVPGEPAGWTNVGFGGPPDKPRFVVTYTIGNGTNNPKMARLVTYRAGTAPDVSAAIKVTDLYTQWNGSETARPVWTGQQFILSWSVSASATSTANTAVIGMDVNGNFTTSVQLLGDNLDHEVSASIACGPDICLATGFAAGLPFGGRGGSWARLFDAHTLAPLRSVIYLDDHSGLMENQRAAFNSATGQFETTWVRWRAHVDFRRVNTDGTTGPLDLTKSLGPASFGQMAMVYNAKAGATLLALASSDNDVFGVTLGDNGYPVSLLNGPRLSDGAADRTVFAYPDAAGNAADGQWLVIYSGPRGARTTIVQGMASGSPK